MKNYRDGQSAPYGLFVSIRPPDARFVGAEGEVLEGLPGALYNRLPNIVAVAMVPVLGGIFVILFPLLVLLVSAAGISRVVSRKLFGGADPKPRLATSAAHFGGSSADGAGESTRHGDAPASRASGRPDEE